MAVGVLAWGAVAGLPVMAIALPSSVPLLAGLLIGLAVVGLAIGIPYFKWRL